ncbi:MAG TPA: MAPEG family protein [Xanthobacteraceae bacterium]|nr:MAPEG family protein [Xanthobacteraceae bacterium]
MTTELKLLALSVVLGFVHIVLASHAASFRYGYRWSATARDQSMPPLEGVAGRLERAARNFLETFPLFAAVVLLAHVAGKESALTWWGANLYVWARVSYLPLYASGVFLVRSLVWNIAAFGIFLILAALFV